MQMIFKALAIIVLLIISGCSNSMNGNVERDIIKSRYGDVGYGGKGTYRVN